MPDAPLRALFFDFDGIVVDTEWAIYETWHALFLEHGHPLPLETYNQCIGTDFETWSPKIHIEELTGNSFEWHEIDATRQAQIVANLEGSPPMPGIPEAMRAGRDAGLKVAVVSSSSHDWVDGWLEKIGLSGQVDITVCKGDAPRIKPEPDLYLEAACQFDLEPATCLVIEDSVNGLKAAIAAGMPNVAIPNRVTACCDFSIADKVLQSASELAALLR